MYSLSHSLRYGDIVAKRGEKLIRCGRRMKPMGVFAAPLRETYLTIGNGEVHEARLPERLVVNGIASVSFRSVL